MRTYDKQGEPLGTTYNLGDPLGICENHCMETIESL